MYPGSFSLGGWVENGKYLEGDIYDGALSTGFYKIEAGTWKTEIYPTPEDMVAGVERTINFNSWYLAYTDFPSFVGIYEDYVQMIKEARAKGELKNLFIYNLRTKEKVKLASADPEWQFKPKWISDTELEYYVSSGERKVYKIK